ncbi:MAG: NlpC/P60 family protein, partial [Rhodococcus sp. (in: high G+C Gram-positive bacteria)]
AGERDHTDVDGASGSGATSTSGGTATSSSGTSSSGSTSSGTAGSGATDTLAGSLSSSGAAGTTSSGSTSSGSTSSGSRGTTSKDPSLTGSAAIELVIDRGMSVLGTPYSWGGGNENGPTRGIRDGGVADSYGDYNKVGFDCSGLMMYAFGGLGISLPHYTGYQYTAGKQVPSSQMRRGDMIFYGPGASQHVALYLGDGKMLEAPQSGSVVKVSPVRYDGMTPYAVRMVQ